MSRAGFKDRIQDDKAWEEGGPPLSLFLLSRLETHECRPKEGYEEDGGQYDFH